KKMVILLRLRRRGQLDSWRDKEWTIGSSCVSFCWGSHARRALTSTPASRRKYTPRSHQIAESRRLLPEHPSSANLVAASDLRRLACSSSRRKTARRLWASRERQATNTPPPTSHTLFRAERRIPVQSPRLYK